MAERDAQIASLSQVVTERDGQMASLTYKLGEAHAEQDNLKDTLAVIYASRSWKVTRPLRYLQRLIRRRKDVAKGLLQVSSRFINSLRQYGLVGTANRVMYRSGLQKRRYSDLLKAPKPYDSRSSRDARPRKTTLVSMLKNEKNIIEAFAGHVLSMFDRVIFIDHQSTDGTQSYLKHLASVYPQLEVYVFDEEGYYQSEVMTWVVTKLIGAEDDGWVFFLDADEFLPFHSREEFETELGNYALFPVISMPWLNLVPLEMVGGNVKDERFLKPAKTAIHHKIAFQPILIPFDEYVIAQGNHALLIGENFRQQFPSEEAFAIYHLPIRTKSQLRDKIRYGIEAYKKMGSDRERGLGVHWDEINQLITKNGITDELMVDMVVRYGEPLSPPYGKSIIELRNRGYFEIKLDLCMEDALPKFDSSMEAEEIKRSRVDDAQERLFLTSKRGMHIVLNAETNTLRFQAG